MTERIPSPFIEASIARNNGDLALALAARGWYIFPCSPENKRPIIPTAHPKGDPEHGKCKGKCGRQGHGLHDATNDPDLVRTWWKKYPLALVGINCGRSGIWVLDVDVKNGAPGLESLQVMADQYNSGEAIPVVAAQKTPSGGYHLIYATPQGVTVPSNAGQIAKALDLRGEGGYICAGGNYIPAGYTGDLATVQVTEAPQWLLDLALATAKKPADHSGKPEQAAPGGYPEPTTDELEQWAYGWYTWSLAEAKTGNRNDTLYKAGQQIKWCGAPLSTGLQYARAFVAAKGLDEGEAIRTMQSAYDTAMRDPAPPPGWHRQQITRQPEPRQVEQSPVAQTAPPTGENESLPLAQVSEYFYRQETGDSELFAALYAGRVAYDHAERAWYLWSGYYWEKDFTGSVVNLVTNGVASQYYLAAGHAQAAGDKDLAKDLASRVGMLRTRRRTTNVLEFASHLPTLALAGDEWDRPGWLLPVANGVLDLRTGELVQPDPACYLRAHLNIAWEGLDAPAPRWEKFQGEVAEGDQEVVGFKQRLYGYMLAGRGGQERIFPVLWGEGGQNGKGTELEAIGYVMGDLSATAKSDVLMDDGRTGDRPSPFLYSLRGKRFVWVKESKEGQRLDVGNIKMLTGGDTIETRSNYMAYNVKFAPTHTVILMTNNKPHAGDDRAFWRRVCLIPYNLSFVTEPKAANERRADRDLGEKLQAEAPGILAWLVRGCLEWQRRGGLEIPAQLLAATEEYRTEEDSLATYESERLIVGPAHQVRGNQLYQDYVTWCGQNNLTPLTGTAFGRKMGKRHPDRLTNPYIVYMGIGLRLDQ